MTELFEPYNYELEKLKITELNKQTYYAKVEGDQVKIYTVAPVAAAAVAAPLAGPAPATSLFDMIDDNVKNYVLGTGDTPDDAVPFYVITGSLDGLNDYRVSDNLYILPSLTPEKIEAKIVENKVASEKAEQERLAKVEADRIAAEKAAQEQKRLMKLEADRVEADRIQKCNSNLKGEDIYIENKLIDYDCFIHFENVKKITLINVTNIKEFFSHIQKLTSIEEIEIISNDPEKVFTFATDFDKTITEENISMLLSNLKNLEIIKFEYMISIKTAETFLSLLMKPINIKSLKSVSICPSEKYFKNMQKIFKSTTTINNARLVRTNNLITEETEKKLKKIQNTIDILLQPNQIKYTENPIRGNKSIVKQVNTSILGNIDTKKVKAAEKEEEEEEEGRLKKVEADRLAAEKAEQERLAKIESEKAETERLKKVEADRLAAEKAEKERLAKVAADKLAAEKAEQERLAKIESDRIAAEKAEQERLVKVEADRIVAEKAEQERLSKIESDRIASEKSEQERLAKVEADKLTKNLTSTTKNLTSTTKNLTSTNVNMSPEELRLKNIAENAEKEKVKNSNISTNLLPPKPPSKEDQETVRITKLLQTYRQNIKTAGYRKGLPNSTTTSSGLSQTNACYINAMLQMLIDIDEFLEYILFMNETKKQQELAKLIKDANALVENFSNIVGVTEKLPEFLIFVYNFIKTDAQPECNDNKCIDEINEFMKPTNSNVDSQILMVQNIIQMFSFPTIPDTEKPKKNDGTQPKRLVYKFKDNNDKDIELKYDYNKYINFGKLFGVINYDETDINFLKINENDLLSPLQCLSDLNDYLVKIKKFENKHQIITALKKIFEFVINGISIVNKDDPVIDEVIKQVNNVQRLINIPKGQQEDASAVYSLLNDKFNDELFQKYGLKYNKDGQLYDADFLSPVNLPANNNTPLSVVIKDNVSMKDKNKDNQRYIIFGNSQSSNTFDQITIEGKTFKPIGIVKHEGNSYGGHYVYYSFKSNKLLNDDIVNETKFISNTSYTRCVVLYERVEPVQVSSSSKKTTPGGSSGTSSSGKTPTKFRASRRKQIKKAPSI